MTTRGSFWIGGAPIAITTGTALRGQMYVAWEKPDEPAHDTPIVLVHGGGGQGTDYLTTPDDRPGWAQLLVAQGYTVYVVDRPGHGRSPLHPDVIGPVAPMMGAETLGAIFVPRPGDHPTAELHTQWPGGREPGDPVFDQFYASQGPTLADLAEAHTLDQAALSALLERIGPAVLVSHSAGGPGVYLAADANPGLVRAVVAVEALGPQFLKNPEAGLELAWGLANARFSYDPPAASPEELQLVTDASGPIPLVLQAEPARRLPGLAQAPIALVSGEASGFRWFDDHVRRFLEQAGCHVDLLRLHEHGVYGNGHGLIFEKNNAEALSVVTAWLDKVLATPANITTGTAASRS